MGLSGGMMPATTAGGAPDPASLDQRRGTAARLRGGTGVETYVCGTCGYGIRRARPPQRCPMCHGSDWRLDRGRRTRAPFGTGGANPAEAALTTLAKRGANRVIHGLASPSGAADPAGFLCECADPDCHTVLWLTADDFARACVDPTWHALAPGHRAAASEHLELR